MVIEAFTISVVANLTTELLKFGVSKFKEITGVSDALETCYINIEDTEVRDALKTVLTIGGCQFEAIIDDNVRKYIADLLIQNANLLPDLTNEKRVQYFNKIVDTFFDDLCDQITHNPGLYNKVVIEYLKSIKEDTKQSKERDKEILEILQHLATKLDVPTKGFTRINTAVQDKDNTESLPDDKDKYLTSLYERTKYCEKYNDNDEIISITEKKYLIDPDCNKHRSYSAMLNNLGKAYYEIDNIEKALENINKAYLIKPEEYKYAINLANLYVMNDNYEEAQKLLSILPEIGDIQLKADIFNVRALIAARKNEIDRSLNLLDEALVLVPNDDTFILNKGYFLCQKGKFEDGLLLLRQVFERNKNKTLFLKSLAFCLLQFHMTKSSLLKCVAIDGNSTFYFLKNENDEPKPDISEELKEACALYDKIISIKNDKTDDKTLLNASVCFMQIGDYKKSLELNNLIYKPGVKHYRAILKNRGIAFACLEKNKEALECFKEYAEEYPEDIDSYMHLGQAYRQLHEYKEALACFLKATEIDNTNPYLISNVATTLAQMECFSPALDLFTKAIELGLNDENAYLNKGITEYNLDKFASARLSFLALIKKYGIHNKNEKQLLLLLSKCTERIGDIDEAIGYIENLFSIDPNEDEVKYHYAVLLFKKGNYCKAETLFTEIATTAKSAVMRDNAINMIKQIQSKTRKIIIP